MKNVITKMEVTGDIALVNLSKVPAGGDYLCQVFRALDEAGVNVDMICQTAMTGSYVSLAFTAGDEEIGRIAEIMRSLQSNYPETKPLISHGNVKISLFGEGMPDHHGVAAEVFEVINRCGADILLITTSSVDISVLVNEAFGEECTAALQAAYQL